MMHTLPKLLYMSRRLALFYLLCVKQPGLHLTFNKSPQSEHSDISEHAAHGFKQLTLKGFPAFINRHYYFSVYQFNPSHNLLFNFKHHL